MIRIKYKKLTTSALEPTIAHSKEVNVGWDLYADHNAILYPLTVCKVGTGIAIDIDQPFIEPIAGFVLPRSGMALKGVTLANSIGLIDPGYRGEIIVPLIYVANPFDSSAIVINKGDRIAQLLFMKPEEPTWVEVEMIGQTERGENGFGSTGR